MPLSPLYLALGGVMLVLVVVDLVWTTLWVDGGAGPLASRLSAWTWRGLRNLSDRHSRGLSLAGPLVLVLTLAMWIGLLWFGWAFLFAGGERALLDTRAQEPVRWTGRLWYVAYTMFTNGNGDFTPNGPAWQIASSLTTASGMLLATLGVSYILSISASVAEKRSFANDVTGLGADPESFLRAGWDGEDFQNLDDLLDDLSSDLNHLAKQHESYPILHYYHSEAEQDSSAMAVVVLAEALTLLEFAVPDERAPNGTLVESARASTETYLQTLDAAFIDPAQESPPAPDLDRLRDADIPTVSDPEFSEALETVDASRRRRLGAVEADAWYWPVDRSD